MSYQPTEQAKRLQSLIATLEQKQAEVKKLDQDMNSQRLALEKAQKDLDQVRGHVAIELQKMDPGMPVAMGVMTFPRKTGS